MTYILTTWRPCIPHAHPNTKGPYSLKWDQSELEENLHYHRRKSVVSFAVKHGHRVLHALPAPAPTAFTNCTNSARGNRGLVLDTRPNRSGQGVPDVVHTTLALTIEDILFGRRWGVGTTPARGERCGVCTLQRILRRLNIAFYCSYSS